MGGERAIAIACVTAIAAAACGGSDGSAGGAGTSAGGAAASATGCNRSGQWTVTYTLTGGSPTCQELRSETVHDEGSGFTRADSCSEGCTCKGSVSGVACSGTVAQTCSGDGNAYTLSCDVRGSSDTIITGTCKVDMTAPLAMSCSYDVRYAWVSP